MKTEIEYYSNGQMRTKIFTKNGRMQGEHCFWYDTGQIGFKIYRDNNSNRIGMEQDWSQEGNRNYIRSWKENNLNGSRISFKYSKTF